MKSIWMTEKGDTIMAKIEAEEVLKAIDEQIQLSKECVRQDNDYSQAFADGYQFACNHLLTRVEALNTSAVVIEQLKKNCGSKI